MKYLFKSRKEERERGRGREGEKEGITVEVTEPLRFFFCRFLSDYATGLFPLLAVVRRLPNLDFLHFQKFRLEEIRNGI